MIFIKDILIQQKNICLSIFIPTLQRHRRQQPKEIMKGDDFAACERVDNLLLNNIVVASMRFCNDEEL